MRHNEKIFELILMSRNVKLLKIIAINFTRKVYQEIIKKRKNQMQQFAGQTNFF
jgi:hypothetical protein